MIDSHCHLAGEEFASDLPGVVERARAAGLTAALVIVGAQDEGECARAETVTTIWPDARLAIGIHPHAAGPFAADPAGAGRLVEERLDTCAGARALGEIGLDYHYDFAPRDAQQAVFLAQIGVARRRGLPVVIHTREADADTFRLLDEGRAGERGGVFHCFTGDRAMARRALDAGFHLSLSGIVTFPRATELHEVARMVPLDRLLIETDSPFLAPVPHRGTRNEPARLVHVAEAIAALRATTPQAVADATCETFTRLFCP
ncbi:MAG: TatD family hydrolase [Acidobacteria bacterium]|nr:TatD family hydrolase [Acidobacteriota bacterium]